MSCSKNPLVRLSDYGQSPWLDFVRRGFTESGALKKMVEEDGLKGVTSNPAILEKSIGHGAEYEAVIAAMIRDIPTGETLSAGALYERIAVEDIRKVSTVLEPVFRETGKRDGYVSLEVSPHLAYKTEETISEAHRLWKLVGRDNLMVKIPSTAEGIEAVQSIIADGINVNMTLIFSLETYKAVLEAYLKGLEIRAERGEALAHIASVASIFVSRVDNGIDAEIDRRIAAGDAESASLKALRGKVAIANAKMAYQHYLEVKKSPRWKALEAKGAQMQRILWASTSTKDEAYRDVYYVEELIGEETVDTIAPATFEAFRDHGKLRSSLVEGLDEARHILAEEKRLGLNLDKVTSSQVTEGCAAFCKLFDHLLETVAARRAAILGHRQGEAAILADDARHWSEE